MPNPPSPTALGPYTAWMYGPGNAYDFFAADRGDAAHLLTGVVERTTGHAPAAAHVPITAGDVSVDLTAPALWSGLATPRFVPFVMTGLEARAADGATLDALWRAGATATVAVSGGGALGPQKGAETRLNAGFPLRADTFAGAVDGESDLTADPSVDPAKPLVVIGIIDDGIPFANRAFDGPDGRSRVDACWVQGARPDGSGRVRFGREITSNEISNLRAVHGADEDALYRSAGAMLPGASIMGDIAHGAHTLGALDEDSDVQVRIIAVDLPPEATWDASGYGRDMLMLAGMHYIFDSADKLAAAYGQSTLPMVLNISYGYSGGAHNGCSTLEAAFDELIDARRALAPTALTLPSGNMFLDAMHAAVDVVPGEPPQVLPWRVQPVDRTSSFMECWLPVDASPDDYTFTLYGPGQTYVGSNVIAAQAPAPDPTGQTTTAPIEWQGAPVGQLSLDRDRTGRWRYLIALAPTESSFAGRAPAGAWAVAVSTTAKAPSTLRFWIQRDISYGRGYTGARQSYFDEAANVIRTPQGDLAETDSPGAMTSRFGTLNGMATGSTPLVVGASRDAGKRPEVYSSAARNTDAKQVDVAADVSRTAAEVGRLGLTVRSGSRVRLTGTSVSAPAIGAVLRDVIAGQPAGPSADNYGQALQATGRLRPVAPEHAPRLGNGVLL